MNKSNIMSDSLASMLTQCGWRPERCVEITPWLAMYERHKLSINREAEVVLKNFGGLTILPVKSPQDVCSSSEISFNANLDFESDRVAYWQGRLHKTLTPVGNVWGEACLVVADTGETYVIWDRFIYFIGQTFIDALEHSLVHAKRKPIEVEANDDA